MPTFTGQDVVNRAWILVQDTQGGTGVRFPSAEALLWVNDGQREAVVHKPSAFTKQLTPILSYDTRQTFTDLASVNSGMSVPLVAALQVVDIPRNISPRKRVIRYIARDMLDTQRPDWHSETTTTEILHWMHDAREPKAFYVYPRPADGASLSIELIFSALPPGLGSLGDVLSLDDVYVNALGYYVLFRMYSKDAEHGQNASLATTYYGLFVTALSGKSASEQQVSTTK